jgi:heterogeneous nuclear ribonucleoprotein K
MKRGPENFEGMASSGADMKRSRAAGDKVEVRVLIPSKIAGSIIGKAGANIQQLRTNNNANVRVPDCEGPERVMNIQVDDAQTGINVIEQV